MAILFFISLILLFLLATLFIYAPWFFPEKLTSGLPLFLTAALAIFASTWYFFAGTSEHIVHAEDDVALRQVALLLEDTLPLPDAVKKQIDAELTRQTKRPGAQPTVWLLQAQLALQQEDYAKAHKAYAAAYAREPSDADIAVSYAQSWYLDETTIKKQAISPQLSQFLHQLQEQYPSQEGLINLLGVVAFNQGDYNKAVEYWQLLITNYPNSSPEFQALQAAIDQAEHIINNNPTQE